MGSESETRDLEVKKARTRTRSKQKQDTEQEFLPLNTTDDSATVTSSNGTANSVKKSRGKRSQKKAADTNDEVADSNGAMNTEHVRKTRQGKRSSSKKDFSRDDSVNVKDSVSKRVKKESAETEDSKEQEADELEGIDTKKPKKPSNRQIKKEKAEQRETLKKEAGRLEATEKALNYVSKWKHANSEWKFEKLRQIWLMDHLLDDELIPDDIFPTVLEYFEGCKGMARQQLLKKGMDVIRKREDSEEAPLVEEASESVEYKRARQLLQALPTET